MQRVVRCLEIGRIVYVADGGGRGVSHCIRGWWCVSLHCNPQLMPSASRFHSPRQIIIPSLENITMKCGLVQQQIFPILSCGPNKKIYFHFKFKFKKRILDLFFILAGLTEFFVSKVFKCKVTRPLHSFIRNHLGNENGLSQEKTF